jgi:hypothetical protein
MANSYVSISRTSASPATGASGSVGGGFACDAPVAGLDCVYAGASVYSSMHPPYR